MPPGRSLAQVEWQLIMRMCDRASLLQLARCCKDTLNAASAEFAWSALSPAAPSSAHLLLTERIAHSLLRFADLAVLVHPNSGDAAIASLGRIPRLHTLDARSSSLRPNQFDSLLLQAHAPLKRLVALYGGCNSLSAESLHLLARHCPSLRTLSVVADRQLTELQLTSLILPLSGVRGLTDLRLDLPASSAALRPLLSYTGLLQLSLRRLSPSAWHPALTAPIVRSLRELTLERVSVMSHQPIDWSACCCNFPASLHTLTLNDCGFIDRVLHALLLSDGIVVSGLRLLRIRVSDDGLSSPALAIPYSFVHRSGSPAPSSGLLHQLMEQRAELNIELRIETREEHVAMSSPLDYTPERDVATAAEWDRAHADYCSLIEQFPGRVRLFCGMDV